MRIFTLGLIVIIAAAFGCRETADREREPVAKPTEPVQPMQPAQPAQPARPGMEAERPTAQNNIVAVARQAGNFGTLLAALSAADLQETLAGPGPYTVFAPTDEAFAKIPKDQLDALLADKEKLRTVLSNHVVQGKVMAEEITAGKMSGVRTMSGRELPLETKDGVQIGGARVVKSDIQASNGVIHVIDTVLLPTNSPPPQALSN